MRPYLLTNFDNIQNALNQINADGSGEIIIPSGEYLTGPLTLPSNLVFTLEDGARIKFIDDPMLYTPVWTRWEGIECYAMHPLFYAVNAENITVRGSRSSPIAEFYGSPNVRGNSNFVTNEIEKGAQVRIGESVDPNKHEVMMPVDQLLRKKNTSLTPEQEKVAKNAKNVGTIDGNGYKWWELFRANQNSNQSEPLYEYEKRLAVLNPGYQKQPSGGGRRETQYLRPPLVQFYNCKNIIFEGFNLMNSPFWTLHTAYCENVTIKNMAIINPAHAINTDAIDIDSCINVSITGSMLDVGDDAIALKSGSGVDGLRVNKPTSSVNVENCVIYSSHGGIAIGSETAGGIRDVIAQNCTFISTQRGIRLKSRRSRGGTIENITFKHLKMYENWCPIVIGMYFQSGVDPCKEEDKWIFSLKAEPIDKYTPHIQNVIIENIEAQDVRSTAAFIVGLPEAPIQNLVIKDFVYTLASDDKLLPTWHSEMTGGLFHNDDRGIKVVNAQIN